MLAADKLQLQSAFKQQATALKEKEFQLHHSNLMTVGTQAAVLASLDVTMFIEFQPPPDSEWGLGGYTYLVPRFLKFLYYTLITTAFCCNLLVVAQTTLLSVLGTALALRGPDGSMIWATEGLYHERKSIFNAFGLGLATTIASVLVVVWLILSPEASAVCMSITMFTVLRLYKSYVRMFATFDFDESETVDFSDIFESGPATITAVPSSTFNVKRKNSGSPYRPTTASNKKNSLNGRSSTARRRGYYESSFSSGDSEEGQNDKSRSSSRASSNSRVPTPILTV